MQPVNNKKAQKAPVADEKAPIVDDSCEDDDDDEVDEDEDEDEEEGICIPKEPPIKTVDVCKFEQCLKETTEEIVNNYETAKAACCVYEQSVKNIMTKKFTIQGLKDLKNEKDERNAFIVEYSNKNDDAMERFNNLISRMRCGIQAPEDRVEAIRQNGREYADIIKRAKSEFLMAWEQSLARDKQWKMLECLLDTFTVEVEGLYPELNLAADTPRIQGDFDWLIIHTKKYIDKLNAQLEDASFGLKSKVNRAYNSIEIPPGKEKEFKAKMDEAYKKARADLAKEYADREIQWKKDSDDALKEKLSVQMQVMNERVDTMLNKKCEELTEWSNKTVCQKVKSEKAKLDAEIETMNVQLRILEAKLEERIKAEVETRRAAQLYAASSSMLNATYKGDPRIKINKELDILKKNSGDDPLVATVLNAIPEEVNEKGLVPENVIKNKFYDMEDLAMKVAMVERQGGPLPIYAFSWLQSRLLFMKPNNIPQVEIDNPPKEPFKEFDTFDLLQRARYYMSRGNLASAVRYVDALEGASRGAAETWYQNANALLQTRQAAQAILAHAAAIRLKWL